MRSNGFKIKLDYFPSTKDPNYICINSGNHDYGFVWNIRLKSRDKLFTDTELKTNKISDKRLSYLLKTYVPAKDIGGMIKLVFKSSYDLQNFYRDVLTFMGGDV